MNRYHLEKWSRRIWSLCAAVVMALALSSCSKSTPVPKTPLPTVTVTVLNHHGEPVADEMIRVYRVHVKTGMMDFNPEDKVAEATTDAEGKAMFIDLLDGDWVKVYTADFRFEGRVDLFAGKSEYTLLLDQFRGFFVEHDGDQHDPAVEKDLERSLASMKKIAKYYLADRQREFSSLEHYVSEGGITQGDAEAFLRIAPLDDGGDNATYIGGIRNRVKITTYEEPIQFVPYTY